MSIYVYVLFSASTQKYYVGQTENLAQRLQQHNNGTFAGSSTKVGIPWEVYYFIECVDRKQAVNIESHIKKMKSKKYFQSFKLYPEIIEKLKAKYTV